MDAGYKITCISIDSGDMWKDALNGIPHSFYHTRDHCYAMSLTTGYETFLFCYKKDNIKIISPVAERAFKGYTDILTPYGFSGFAGNGDCPDFPEAWSEFVKKRKYVCGYLSQNPAFQNESYFVKDDVYSKASLYFIDLRKSLTELYESLDANRKRQLKNYRREEAGFVYDREKITGFFINNYHDFLNRINASSASYFTKETLEYICSLDNIFMVGAGREKLEAVYIFGYTEHCGECLFNVSTEEGREQTPYLLWCGLKFFRSKKIPLMSLGGGSFTNDSIDQSKQRFGSYGLPFVNLKQIYDKVVYDELCKGSGTDLTANNYFPLYRKTNILEKTKNLNIV